MKKHKDDPQRNLYQWWSPHCCALAAPDKRSQMLEHFWACFFLRRKYMESRTAWCRAPSKTQQQCFAFHAPVQTLGVKMVITICFTYFALSPPIFFCKSQLSGAKQNIYSQFVSFLLSLKAPCSSRTYTSKFLLGKWHGDRQHCTCSERCCIMHFTILLQDCHI